MALVVFTGGARSGKSAAATRLAALRAADGTPVVVAVFGSADDDPEMAERIARHRDDRPSAFRTHEAADSSSWLGDIGDDEVLLLDCLGTMLGRVMAEQWPAGASPDGEAPAEALPEGYAVAVSARFDKLVARIGARRGDTIVVTNEVGDGVVPAYAAGRLFRDLLGRANRALIAEAAAAYLVVGGRLVDLAALSADAHWPED